MLNFVLSSSNSIPFSPRQFEYEKNDAKLRNGQLQVDMNHFFVADYLQKIQHPTLCALLEQILCERRDFLSKINNNVVEFQVNNGSPANNGKQANNDKQATNGNQANHSN